MRRGVLRLRDVRRLFLPLSRRHLPSPGGYAGPPSQREVLAPACGHLADRVREIKDGTFEELLQNLMQQPIEEMKELYNHRDIEK